MEHTEIFSAILYALYASAVKCCVCYTVSV